MSVSFKIRFFRDFQSRFGYWLDLKYDLQRISRKMRKIPFEPEFEILKHLNPNGKIAIDVGANQGQSIDAVRLYHADTHIHSFEPSQGPFNKLKTKFGYYKNLSLYNKGLGQEEMSCDIFVPHYRNFVYDGLASFSKNIASNWLNKDTVWRFKPELSKVVQETCVIDLLDNFSLNPFFLKVHVQGFEHDVLLGGKETIRKHLPVILIASHDAANQWLRDEGWQQFAYDNNRLIPSPNKDEGSYNWLFLHPNNADHTAVIKSLT